MQPFVNPYLFQNPYFSNYGNNVTPNTQNAFNQPQPIGISGKYVNDFAEVMASDVPMGGQPSVFIKNDRSELQMREWSPNGQIITTLYKPYIEPKQEEVNNLPPTIQQPLFDVKTEVLEPIFDKLAELEQQVAKLSNSVVKPATKTKAVAE